MQTPPPAPVPVQPVQPVQPQAMPVTALSQQKTNALCIVGLIGSLASIILLGTTSIIFLIISIIGLISAGKKNEKGKGQAIAGIIISAILVVVWIIGMTVGLSGVNKYRKKYNDYTRYTTTEREETTRRTTRETTEDTEATTEETTRETSRETSKETTEETSATASKNGAYLTSVGNEKTGTVPLTSGKWVNFLETGGFSKEVTEHQQAKDFETGSIIGLFVLNVTNTPEELAKASMYSMEKAGATGITGAHVKIGGYDAIQCYGKYPDGQMLVIWYFRGDDGQMRKITVEFPSSNSKAFHLVEDGYKLDR